MRSLPDLSDIQLVSWDIDGTLYALPEFMRVLKRDLLLRMFSPAFPRAWRDLWRLVRFKRHMDKVRAAGGSLTVPPLEGRDAIGQTMDDLYARLLPSIGALPGIDEVLQWFHDRGIPQVALSDYRPSTKLRALGIEHYFCSVYAAEDLGHLKPSPVPFTTVLRDHQVEACHALHIGDREDTDGEGAKGVGMQYAILGIDYPTAADLLKTLKPDKRDDD